MVIITFIFILLKISKMKLLLYQFYLKYNNSGNHTQTIFIQKCELNNYSKIKVDDNQFISPFDYFDICI